jgi:Do/DeqQ family serine protease
VIDKMKKIMFFKPAVLSILIGLFLTSCEEAKEKKIAQSQLAPNSVAQKQLPQTRKEVTLSFAPLVKKIAPAVVNVYALYHPKSEGAKSPYLSDPLFKQFFEYFYGGEGKEKEQPTDFALGSGIIVDKQGLILTNYHVIKDADVIQVALADKREFKAELVVIDKRSDLALLKINCKDDLPFLEVTPQEDLEVGDLVLAIGNPFGIGQTVTTGIISALARSEEGIGDFRTFIQTDAAINPGNSGGPLVTTDGRLVGINTAIYSKSGGSVGIGFAIPTSLAIPVIESVNRGGKIIRPWIGLAVEEVTSESAESLGLSHPFGVLVRTVYPNGPADEAGLKPGDFIGAFNGREIEDDAFLDYQVGISSLGEKAILTILRNGEEKMIPIQLREPLSEKDPEPVTIEGANPLRGVKVRTLSPALALDLGFDPMKQGVIIMERGDVTPAAQLGIQPGDVIEGINKEKITTKEQLAKFLETDVSSWDLVLRRGTKVMTLQVAAK